MSANLPLWIQNASPAQTVQGTTSKAAVAGTTHVAKRITVTCATVAATAQTPLVWNLRDSTTGAGNVLMSGAIAALGTTTVTQDFDNLNIQGVAGQAMTLEFTGGGVANALLTLNLQGYDL